MTGIGVTRGLSISQARFVGFQVGFNNNQSIPKAQGLACLHQEALAMSLSALVSSMLSFSSSSFRPK